MQRTLHIRTTVLPAEKIETVDREVPVGEVVEVVISPVQTPPRSSAWRIISEGPGQRLFKTAKEADDYLAKERTSWDR